MKCCEILDKCENEWKRSKTLNLPCLTISQTVSIATIERVNILTVLKMLTGPVGVASSDCGCARQATHATADTSVVSCVKCAASDDKITQVLHILFAVVKDGI